MKVLHITAGLPNSGSFKGVYLLHKYLLKKGIRSTIINDSPESTENNLRKIKFVNEISLIQDRDILKEMLNNFIIKGKSLTVNKKKSLFIIKTLENIKKKIYLSKV